MADDRGGTADPRVAVVVITRNRARELSRSLQRLRQLPEHPDVVVVDNGSEDQTVSMVDEQFPDVTLLPLGVNLGAAGRNIGVNAVTAPYVAFCDDDTWWSPGSLARAADLFDAHPQVAVLNAHITVEPAGTEDPLCSDLEDSPVPGALNLPGPRLVSFVAGAAVVRREAFQSVGGFEPRIVIGGEEEWLAADLMERRWAIVYTKNIRIHHHPSRVRDGHLRRRQGIRNTLWFTWTRRPFWSATRRTIHLLRRLPPDRVSCRALLEALRGVGWVIRTRCVVSPEVEEMFASVDRLQFRSGARHYIS